MEKSYTSTIGLQWTIIFIQLISRLFYNYYIITSSINWLAVKKCQKMEGKIKDIQKRNLKTFTFKYLDLFFF